MTPSGQKRIEVRAWCGDGEKRIDIRRRFKTLKEANTFIDTDLMQTKARRRCERESGPDPMKTLTFGDEVGFWMKTNWANWSPGWRLSISQYARDLGPRLNHLKIEQIKPALLKEIEAELRGGGNAKETVRHKLGMVKTILNYSVEMERIPYNPVARYKPPKGDRADIEFWEHHEIQSFLAFARDKYPCGSPERRNYIAYLVASNTALRAGELWALRVDALRPSLGLIQVTEQFHSVAKGFRPLKGKQGRVVPLNASLSAEIDTWIRVQGLTGDDLLFTNEARMPIDHDNFYKRVFKSDLAEWGGRPITFHGLRHTGATLMLDQGIDIRTLQRILGHKDLETTRAVRPCIGPENSGGWSDIFDHALSYAFRTTPRHSGTGKSPRRKATPSEGG